MFTQTKTPNGHAERHTLIIPALGSLIQEDCESVIHKDSLSQGVGEDQDIYL